MGMHVVSVNVGKPRELEWKGRIVSTSIFKQAVVGRIAVQTLDLDGDQQADLSVHGGPEKAIYAYSTEHYDYWRQELPDMTLPWGMFGENLSIAGFHEDDIYIGDQFRVGTALLQATQPRFPCYKLGIRFGHDDMVKRFLHAGRYGVYFAVLQTGTVEAGDTVERVYRDPHNVVVSDIVRLYVHDKHNTALMRRVIEHEGVPAGWRDYFREQIETITK